MYIGNGAVISSIWLQNLSESYIYGEFFVFDGRFKFRFLSPSLSCVGKLADVGDVAFER